MEHMKLMLAMQYENLKASKTDATTKTDNEEKEKKENEDKTGATTSFSKPRCPSPDIGAKAVTVIGHSESQSRPYSDPLLSNTDFSVDMTNAPAVPPRPFSQHLMQSKQHSCPIIGKSCVTEESPDLKQFPYMDDVYSYSTLGKDDEERLGSSPEAPPLPARGPPIIDPNFMNRLSTFKHKRDSCEEPGMDSTSHHSSPSSPVHTKCLPPSWLAPPVPSQMVCKKPLTKRHSVQVVSDVKYNPNTLDFSKVGGANYHHSDRALKPGWEWNETVTRKEEHLKMRGTGNREDSSDVPPPVPPLPAHLQMKPHIPWINRFSDIWDHENDSSFSDDEELTTEPRNQGNTKVKTHVNSEERPQLPLHDHKVGGTTPTTLVDKFGVYRMTGSPMYRNKPSSPPPPIPPQRSESLYQRGDQARKSDPSPKSSGGSFQGAIPKKRRPTAPSVPVDPTQNSDVNIKQSKMNGDGNEKRDSPDENISDQYSSDISSDKEETVIYAVIYKTQEEYEASESRPMTDEPVPQRVTPIDHEEEEEDTGTVDSTNFKGSRSPLMSPGASPRVNRRDEVIPPPPVPPRKASPAPSPPSTPAVTHRLSSMTAEEEDADEETSAPLPPLPTTTSTSTPTPSSTMVTTPTIVTTPTSTPASPPRTVTIVTLDPNNLAVETSSTGTKDGGRKGSSVPSPQRPPPFTVPHIVPRASKLMRSSGSTPSLSSSAFSPTSTTPTPPPPTSTPATTPTPVPSAPPFPSSYPVNVVPPAPSPTPHHRLQQPQTPSSPLGGPPTTTAPPPPVSVSSPVTVITYTPVLTYDDQSELCDQTTSTSTTSCTTITTTTTTITATTPVTPRPRTILPSQSTLMPPTPSTTPSPSSPSSITSSTSSSSSCSASASSGMEVDRRPSATSHGGDLEHINEEPPYENTTLPPSVSTTIITKKSATDSDLPNFPAPSAPTLGTITKSLSADRSMNVTEESEGEDTSTPYENLHMDYLATLTQEGFAQNDVIRVLVITRNDITMARDILREFASKKS
ncbi:hypothetical protein Pcinc_015704 [Petrolisthes cinctipes]|uniref:Uncharacterized protein n=1 Tax=Petrolisthes cinctipes TaxID=88211 RepID=A0AAE1FSI9_PETCI|nr:hypothetical protein Pcinc_015704 [Petrolisthes cinctipes]